MSYPENDSDQSSSTDTAHRVDRVFVENDLPLSSPDDEIACEQDGSDISHVNEDIFYFPKNLNLSWGRQYD